MPDLKNRNRLFYIGSRPNDETTGGAKYMNEVLDYLDSHFSLIILNPEEERFFKERVNILNLGSIKAQFLSNLWAIRKLKEIGKSEIIIMNSYLRHRFLFFALWARSIKKCQLVIFVNAIYHYSLRSGFLNRLDKIITRILLNQAVLVIANSNATKEELINLGVKPDKFEVIYPRLDMPPEVDLPGKEKENGIFDILFVGYCEPFKELHVLIRAIGRLKDLPVCLHIVGENKGEPEYMDMLRDLIADLGLEDKVIFHGRLEKAELSTWFKRADLFVSPSRGEGYGRALAEAMYFGLPVIGADKGASKELIEHGINGFLFESGNDESLATFIFNQYKDESLRQQFGKTGKELIKNKANFKRNIGKQFFNILQKYSLL
ncbi:MAG: glycosyltransferase family 4 protein [Thermodesulfobacteriota bacterium]